MIIALLRVALSALFIVGALTATVTHAEVVKIAHIDSASGLFASLGQNIRRNISESTVVLAKRDK